MLQYWWIEWVLTWMVFVLFNLTRILESIYRSGNVGQPSSEKFVKIQF